MFTFDFLCLGLFLETKEGRKKIVCYKAKVTSLRRHTHQERLFPSFCLTVQIGFHTSPQATHCVFGFVFGKSYEFTKPASSHPKINQFCLAVVQPCRYSLCVQTSPLPPPLSKPPFEQMLNEPFCQCVWESRLHRLDNLLQLIFSSKRESRQTQQSMMRAGRVGREKLTGNADFMEC